MKTIRQILRQPIKLVFGIVLMTLAIATLCVCVGQALAALTTKADLDRRFSTAAILAVQEDLEKLDMITVEQDMIEWLEEMEREHPEIVKRAAQYGFLSAVIPELQPYNVNAEYVPVENLGTNAVIVEDNGLSTLSQYTNSSNYDSAMLVITLEQIGRIYAPDYVPKEIPRPNREDFETKDDYMNGWVSYERYKAHLSDMSRLWSRAQGYAVELVGTVTNVVSLQDGLRSPEGMTARVYLILPSLEDIESLNLELGQQYIVYGMEYQDIYRNLIATMKGPYSAYSHISFEPFNPSLLKEITKQQQENFAYDKHMYVEYMYNYVPLTQSQYKALNAVSMTVCLPSNLVGYESGWVDGSVNGNQNGSNIYVAQNSIQYQTADGQIVTLTVEEYNDLYAVPTIAKLNGSVEDFLNSAAGVPWQEAIARDEMNNHAFSVIGVEDIDCLGTFAMEKSKIGEGRGFTQEEVETGAKVCIIHERIAALSGISLGDTITLSFYATDHGQPYAGTFTDNKGLLNPRPSLYFSTTPVLETAEYTVVGFWQGDLSPKTATNYYSFGGNTVFVPQSSVSAPMEHCNTIPFISVQLENGTIEQFHSLAMKVGYAGRFKYTDQGYADIAVNFHNYADLSQQVLRVGLVVYSIFLLLFLLLYPGSMKKTVRTMKSLGCHFGKRLRHVLTASLAVLIPATALGCNLGTSAWEKVVTELQTTAESTIALQLPGDVLAKIAVAQLILALVLSLLVAVCVAAPKGMNTRR